MTDLHEIILTLTTKQFEAFASDLELLRDSGAGSNTQAVIEAVRDHAARTRVLAVTDRKAAA
jgi:hypothetical protein